MSKLEDFKAQEEFEADVRRAAEGIWGLAPGDCQPEHYSDDPIVHELDGLIRLREITHLVMATVSSKLDKTKDDVRKLCAAEKIEAKQGRPITKWFITPMQLNAEHIKYCKEHGVNALSLPLFKQKFFDARAYIGKRRVSAFGSVRNPANDSITLPEDEYVKLPLTLVANESGHLPQAVPIEFSALIDQLLQGQIFVLVAPFGAGKSLTVREVFLEMSKKYLKAGDGVVPISINLRDHWGARYGDEVFDRHAKEIGFSPKEDLLSAWRTGLGVLLLDGFDEVAVQVVARNTNRNFLREARLEALRSIQDILSKIPENSGVLISGRDHYFDDSKELARSLGLVGKKFFLVELGEFTEDAANKYLAKKKVMSTLPDWLPRKPLILSYLASKDLLSQVVEIDGSHGFGFAWNSFLAKICEREAGQAVSSMDSLTLRHLLERLAIDCRASSQGNGPIAERDLADAYLAETGDNPGDAVTAQLQRLPGLNARGMGSGIRSFVDQDMLFALQGGALARFILEGSVSWSKKPFLAAIDPRALAMAAYLLSEARAQAALPLTTAIRLSHSPDASINAQLIADCFQVALVQSEDDGVLDGLGLQIREACLGTLVLEQIELKNVTFSNCQIDEVSIDEVGIKSNCRFINCDIQKISGLSESAIPADTFVDCNIESFEDYGTNAAIVRSSLSPKLKALFTALRKLYSQAGGGRKLNAFKRGLPPGPIQDAIDVVLPEMVSEGLAFIEKGVAQPVRKYSGRVKSMIQMGEHSGDSLVQRVKAL